MDDDTLANLKRMRDAGPPTSRPAARYVSREEYDRRMDEAAPERNAALRALAPEDGYTSEDF